VTTLPQRKASDSKSSSERVVSVSQLSQERGSGAKRRNRRWRSEAAAAAAGFGDSTGYAGE